MNRLSHISGTMATLATLAMHERPGEAVTQTQPEATPPGNLVRKHLDEVIASVGSTPPPGWRPEPTTVLIRPPSDDYPTLNPMYAPTPQAPEQARAAAEGVGGAMMRSCRLSASAESCVQVDVLDPAHDDDCDFPVLRAATMGRLPRLELPADPAAFEALMRELTDLSNAQDGLAHDRDLSKEERAFARRACRSLSDLHGRLRRQSRNPAPQE